MTRRRALSPLTLLLVSLLCYGFVMVWTQNVAFDTSTTFEELSTPFSPALVKILTGGNFSMSVKPWESTTGEPVGSTQSNLAIHNIIHENATTAIPKDTVTIPPPTTMESLFTIAPTGGTEANREDELISAMGSTRAPLSTTTSNAINALTERKRSTTELGMPSEGGTEMVEDETGITEPYSLSENSNKVSSGTTVDGGTTDTPATNTGVSEISDRADHPRAVKKTSSVIHAGGRMTWRVKLQSSLSREKAVITFFEKACDVIIKNLHMKDVFLIGGPDRTALRCL